LLQCTKEEQRVVIRFLWSEEVRPAQIHRRMLLQYDNSCLAKRRWTRVVDEQRSSRPRTASTDGNAEKAEELNERVTMDEILGQLVISHVSVYKIIHKNLKFKKVCAT
jgi:hypothetical protein